MSKTILMTADLAGGQIPEAFRRFQQAMQRYLTAPVAAGGLFA